MPNNQVTPTQQKLEQKYHRLKQSFTKKHGKASDWVKANTNDLSELKTFVQQLFAAVSLAGQIAVSQPVEAQVQQQLRVIEQNQRNKMLSQVTQEEHQEIVDKMISLVNSPPGHLESERELYLEQQLTDILGIELTAELEGHRLNHTIGIMGGEQHLKRYPNDNLASHDAYLEAGMAPVRGAFGWFTQQGKLTDKSIQREKYYFAVQTLYLPNWNRDYKQLKPWYKFRKMIVINPTEEKAVVGVVGDAGPALWIKKQFGGSPEVIREGQIWSPQAKGRVMMFFVDDPEDKIELGPIDFSWQEQEL